MSKRLRLLVLLFFPALTVSSAVSADPVSADLSARHSAAAAPVSVGNAPSAKTSSREAEMLQSLYARAPAPTLWSEQGRPTRQANELVDVLLTAGTYGLAPGDYGADAVATARDRLVHGGGTAQQNAEDRENFDRQLSRAAIRLVAHLHYGRIDPRTAGFDLKAPRNDLDVVDAVIALASAARVRDAIGRIEPGFHHYALLKTALARYRALAAEPTLTQLPPFGPRSLHEGDSYAGAPALRQLLTALGDMPPDGTASADGNLLDAALIDALKRFQSRHGITADGTLGKQTFAALTTPLAQRVRQIELTLERWRWLPPFTTPPIIVNIPQFKLFAFNTTEDRAASVLQMPVIVGQAFPHTRTPVFADDMEYVIFRPYWDVPRSIVVRELLPKLRANPGYLQKNHFELVRGESDNSPAVPPSPAAIEALGAGQLRLRQRPGDDNALGLVKFIFPNDHNVYMHSTPARRLFEESRRAFSHGCIRVSDPVALAVHVLRNAEGTWDNDRIAAAMTQGPNAARVPLKRPIRVMILYGTAQATEAGPVQFFDDIYGHDRKLEALLGLRPVYKAAAAR